MLSIITFSEIPSIFSSLLLWYNPILISVAFEWMELRAFNHYVQRDSQHFLITVTLVQPNFNVSSF